MEVRHTVVWWVVASMLIVPALCTPKNPLELVLNELNIRDCSKVREDEYVELRSNSPLMRDSLQGYHLVSLKGMCSDTSTQGSCITLSINLWNKKVRSNRLFVAGGKDVEADISTDDPSFGFQKKFESKYVTGTQRSIASFLLPADQVQGETINNEVPYGLALLYSESPLPELKLSRSKKSIPVTQEIENLVRDKLVDLVVYATTAPTDRCLIFELLHPPFVVPVVRQYILRETNVGLHIDLSLNRCTVRNAGFLPEKFRIGQKTPGLENDCSGEPFVLEDENALAQVEEECMPATLPELAKDIVMREGTDTRDSCTPAKQPRARLENISPEKMEELASKKMRTSARCSEVSKSGISSSSGGDHVKYRRYKERANYLFDERYEDDEFATDRYFQESWLTSIRNFQSHLLPVFSIENRPDVRAWFEYLPNEGDMTKSKFRCRICAQNLDKIGLIKGRMYQKPKVCNKEGVLYPTYDGNQVAINKHSESATHMNVVEMLRSQEKKSIKTSLQRLEEEQQQRTQMMYKETSNMMRTVYTEIMINLPLASHNVIVTLMELNGLKRPLHHYERRSAQRIADFISDEMHGKLKIFLTTRHGHHPVSLIIDGSTDVRQHHYLICYIQVLDDNFPMVYFYRLIPLDKGEKSNDILDAILTAFVDDDISDYMHQNLVAVGADGAAVMIGKHNGVVKKLSDWAGRRLVGVHCMAHRVNLAIRRAFHSKKKHPYMFHFESLANKLFTFYYSHGHKRRDHLWSFSDKKLYELNYIFETRWVSSELSAIKRIIQNYEALVPDLQAISEDTENFDGKTMSTALGMSKQLQDRNFVELLFYMGDLLNHLARFSQNMQRRPGLLIEQAEVLDNFVKTLKKSGSYDEGNILDLLKKAKCFNKDGIESSCATLAKFEESPVVKLFGHELTTNANSAYKPLTEIRFALIESLVQEVESYMPLSEAQPFSILDPQKMPEKSHEQAFYGLSEIRELASLYDLTEQDLEQKWVSLLGSLTSSPDWCRMKGASIKLFWKFFLSSPSIEIPEILRKVIKNVLVTPISSADAERGFSILFHTRSNRRSRLTGKHLDGILRIRINGSKDISKFPAFNYAKKWHSLGRHLTDMRAGGTHFEPADNLADDNPEETSAKVFLDGSNLF